MKRRTVAKSSSIRTPFTSTSYEIVRRMLETAREVVTSCKSKNGVRLNLA